jgi:hypothetical protein
MLLQISAKTNETLFTGTLPKPFSELMMVALFIDSFQNAQQRTKR